MIAAAVTDISEIWLIKDDRPDSAEFATGLVPGISAEADARDALSRDEPREDNIEARPGEVEEGSMETSGKVSPTVTEAEADTVTGAVTVGPPPELDTAELV
jgi:hypothetical protein